MTKSRQERKLWPKLDHRRNYTRPRRTVRGRLPYKQNQTGGGRGQVPWRGPFVNHSNHQQQVPPQDYPPSSGERPVGPSRIAEKRGRLRLRTVRRSITKLKQIKGHNTGTRGNSGKMRPDLESVGNSTPMYTVQKSTLIVVQKINFNNPVKNSPGEMKLGTNFLKPKRGGEE